MAYDNVCKFLIESFPRSYLGWILEQSITDPPQILKTELPVEPVRADFVSFWQVGGRIVHVEFQTEPKQNVPLWMLNYFATPSAGSANGFGLSTDWMCSKW